MNLPRKATPEMIQAAEDVEDLYRRGTPETWAKVWAAMYDAWEHQEKYGTKDA